jgi:site-specific recombinase XerD
MPILGWRVHFTRRQLMMPRTARPTLRSLNGDGVADWLDSHGIEDGVPFLISPDGRYDGDLNAYFLLHPAPENTLAAIGYDLASFLTFVWHHRQPLGKRSWRDATPEDRAAYHRWRRVDERGPGVKGSTWGREVATVNSFYRWAIESGFVEQNPILQRPARDRRWRRSPEGALTPAEAPKDGHPEGLAWLPPASYRRWRDVGVRGYVPTGLPDHSFRGRNAARNATFCDLMVRTGLRLTEQASLTLFEVPDVDEHRAYAPTRLPAAIAKNGSGRRIYIPATVLRDVWDYIRFDRAELVEQAHRRGTYDRLPGKLVVEDPQYAVIAPPTAGGRRRPVETLNPRQRRRLFICGAEGLEPAVLWLNRRGLPVMPGTWQSMFGDANDRCRRNDVALRAHPHLLRHTYAVVTLEQLQREHIRELAAMNPAQRTTYEQIFGDPLDWVRRQMGHRSVETTFKYLHTLNELAMETRLALVPDEWAEFGLSAGELIGEVADEQPTDETADSA